MLFTDKVLEPDDLKEAEAAEAEEDIQTAGEELPSGQANEHQRRDLGQVAQAVVSINTTWPTALRQSSLDRSVSRL